jgi:hypothetical protein
MKTGQTTSYRTGDDGDLERGRNVSFTVLAENNPFGNTNRFTDELGGQTYTNNIVIDWSTYDGATVLGWRRTLNGSSVGWAVAIDNSLLVSIGTFTTGWRLPNIAELFSILNFSQIGNMLNYSPYNITSTLWSSTGLTTSAYYIFTNNNNYVQYSAKTNVYNFISCRTFTVTGTTLS